MPAPRIFTPGDHALGTPEFRLPPRNRGPLSGIAGVTRDSAGAILASCDVHLFRTATDVEVDQTTSDGSGVYSFPNVTPAEAYYVLAYRAGSPDVTGATLNTLTGAAA